MFQTENAKVNYAMSFLKGMALDYFEPFLDTPDDEPAWLEDYELFIEELLINFGPYDALTDAEVELDALIMKDSHKATSTSSGCLRSATTMTGCSFGKHTPCFQRGSKTK